MRAADKVLPKTGSIRRAVYDLIEAAGTRGMTDDELEKAMGRSHQTVSARRNGLMNDELVCDSGLRRITKTNHEAIAWIAVPHAIEPIQDGFDFTEKPAHVAEPESDPVFDPRLIRVSNTLAGTNGGDWRQYLKSARAVMDELGLMPGADPI